MFGKALQEANSSDLPSFDPRSGELSRGNRLVRLEPRSADLLALLQAANGAIVTRQELLDHCWEPGGGSDEALTQAVAQIRRAFEQLGIMSAIETLAKRGYRLRVRLADQCGIARPTSPRTSLIIGGLILALMLALSFAHPIRHAVRHALGLGPPTQPSSTHGQAS
jgi:DNA-binding winged helix-turn-helix (wHTH) protein